MVTETTVRSAKKSDQKAVEDFLNYAAAVHRHLDWRTPFDWLGNKQFLINEKKNRISGLLICTAEPQEVYWLRVFGSINFTSLRENWQSLFQYFLAQLSPQESLLTIAAIAYYDWMKRLLDDNHWKIHQRVVQLKWTEMKVPRQDKSWPSDLTIRPMETGDLKDVAEIDRNCFKFIWQQSQDVIRRAYMQSSYTTVAVLNNEIIGFQISNSHKSIAHLTRLAVSPKFQGQYIGQALVQNMLVHFRKPWIHEITVNTQRDNEVSLNLYKKMGFKSTAEDFPIYLYQTG